MNDRKNESATLLFDLLVNDEG